VAGVSFIGVSKSKDGREVLSGIDLSIPAGALTAIVGPSGSGKTTLLRMICGLDRPDAGSVSVGGEDVGGRPPDGVAMVFQGDALYEHLDVGSNLKFPLQIRGAAAPHVEEKSRSTARRAGVSRLWGRQPRTLSGGERGMVAAARAISRDGLRILLLDEPLSGADRHVRQRFRRELRRLHDEEGVTTVLATNDQEEAMAVADVLAVVMDGRLAQVGSPRSVFESPETAAVASFVGVRSMNLFPALFELVDGRPVVSIGGDRIALDRAPRGIDIRTRVLVGLHAHELVVSPPGTPFGRTIHVSVSRVEDLGSSVNVLFGLGRSPAGTFVMTENHPAAVRPGDRLELTWAPGRMRLFRADTGRAIPM
jgi:ABC-type sugar transport system ATPase subunit